jgi:O-antigen polysaccharide polymerase Wzy
MGLLMPEWQERVYNAPIDQFEALDDTEALRSTIFFVPISFFVMYFQLLFYDSTPVMLMALAFYLTYSLNILYIFKGIRSPLGAAVIVLLMYSNLPFLPGQQADLVTGSFGLEGGHYINSVASYSFVTAVYLSTYFIFVPKAKRGDERSAANQTLIASTVAASISCLLSALYILRFGAVGIGDVSYGASFLQQQESGAGAIMMSVPLALAAASTAFAADRLTPLGVLRGTLPFAMLFVSTAQRKYLIVPAILFVASRVRIESITKLLLFSLGLAVGTVVFAYLGYLREMDYSLVDAMNPDILATFWSEFGQHISGETTTVLATASAAYASFIPPLPSFGDYLQAWQMSVPQFLARMTFNSINDRFSHAISPVFAEAGGGWGFSFFGEAYLIGGYVGVFLATSFVVITFRYIYCLAVSHGRNSIYYAFMICGVYHALWFQRNAMAFFIKEYLVYQLSILVAVFFVARLIHAWSALERPRTVRNLWRREHNLCPGGGEPDLSRSGHLG